MLNIEDFVRRCRAFADRHEMVNSFGHGPVKDMAIAKDVRWPNMHVVYMSVDYSEGAKTYSFQIYVLDLPDQDTDPDQNLEILGRTEAILEDLMSDIERGHNAFREPQLDFEVQSASADILVETVTSAATGMVLTLSVAVPFAYDSCNTPITLP